MERVILVNERDEELGSAEKLEAHQKGLLHRAFSIFIFSPDKKWWIHRRALGKYHSGGLWTNTCCGHPRPGESTEKAAQRRLKEECGLEVELRESFQFMYQSDVGGGLTEWEFDHVFLGVTQASPLLNPEEAMEWKCLTFDELNAMVESHPDSFTVWFKHCFRRINDHL